MATFHSIKGTTQPNFKFGKGGPTLHQDTSAPTGGTGVDGDFFIRHGGSSATYQKLSSTWVQLKTVLNSVLVFTSAGDITVATTDEIIIVNKSSGAATAVNLPAGSTVDIGKTYQIKDGKGDAGTNNITIDGDSTETLDGQLTVVMNQNYEATTVVWNGTEWNII